MNERRKWVEWGPHGVRRRTSPSIWNAPLKWQRNAAKFQEEHGRRQRVFCSSLSDFFDNKAPEGARDEAWGIIKSTPDLDWQLLTKRPENIRRFLPPDWGDGYPNVWLGTTTEDQTAYDRRWVVLSRIPAAVHFISYEPAIGPVRLLPPLDRFSHSFPDWVIFGGESGPNARMVEDPSWATNMLNDCERLRVPFFLKQWGTWPSNPLWGAFDLETAKSRDPDPHAKGGAGLQGRLWRDFPKSGAPLIVEQSFERLLREGDLELKP